MDKKLLKQMKDGQGRYRGPSSLFLELNFANNYGDPVYTISEYPKEGLPSARQIYLECEDPTEYKAAMALVGSWDHWEKLTSNRVFLKYLNKWREELEVKLRCKALDTITELSSDATPSGLSAAKFLAEGKWKGSQRGRPTKAEVQRETKVQLKIAKQVDNDWERLTSNDK